jgi:hypothetical protein
MESAVQRVQETLSRATGALQAAGVPYAVTDENAIAYWVSRVDPSAVRNSRRVEVMLRREDWDHAVEALETVGFSHWNSAGVDFFLDGATGKPRDAVHFIFANERSRLRGPLVNPDVSESEQGDQFGVLSLQALVRMKLTAFRDEDRVHIRDLIDVGLVDASWPARFPVELASRLQSILDTPEG